MKNLRIIKAMLFKKSYLTLTAWLSIILPVAFIAYTALGYDKASGDKLPLVPIAVAVAIMVLLSAGLIVFHSYWIKKRDNLAYEVYREWQMKIGLPYASSLDEAKRRKIVKQRMAIEWGMGLDIKEIRFRSDGGSIGHNNIVQFIDYFNAMAKDGYGYAVNLNDVTSGKLIGKQIELESPEYSKFNARFLIFAMLKRYSITSYNEIPRITFSKDFESNASDRFTSVVVSEMVTSVSSRNVLEMIKFFQMTYPENPNYRWAFDEISSSAFSLKMLKSDDERFMLEAAEKFLKNAYAAAKDKARVWARLNSIEILDFDSGVPVKFNLVFDNGTSIDDDRLTKLLESMDAILTDNFKGSWNYSERILDTDTISFSRR